MLLSNICAENHSYAECAKAPLSTPETEPPTCTKGHVWKPDQVLSESSPGLDAGIATVNK